MLNKNKIAFIICANNDLYYNECAGYINRLHIPEGYETDIICITGAESMAQGYNYAMNESDAKYKVYLHQDVFIYHVNFIADILEIFHADDKIGMIGMVGGIDLPQNAFIYNAWNVGCAYVCNFNMLIPLRCKETDQDYKWKEVQAVDGMLMATQYDVEWREDLGLGWDFYDVSQSLEFLRSGYKVVVPYQETSWCLHDCGHSKLLYYDEARKQILEEYKEYFKEEYKPVCNREYILIQEKFFSVIKKYIEGRKFESALAIGDAVRDKAIRSNDLQYALNMLDIYTAEKDEKDTESFFSDVCSWDAAKEKYDMVKFTVRHIENGINSEDVESLVLLIKNKIFSLSAIDIIAGHSAINKNNVIKKLIEFEQKE